LNREQERKLPQEKPVEEEVQQGADRGSGKDERLKRVVRQHPQRDEPKVDSVEPGETPPP
jgi:hypothetical protein